MVRVKATTENNSCQGIKTPQFNCKIILYMAINGTQANGSIFNKTENNTRRILLK